MGVRCKNGSSSLPLGSNHPSHGAAAADKNRCKRERETHTNPEREDANWKEGKENHSRLLSSPKLTYDEDDGVHTNSSTKIWLTNTVVIKKALKSLRALEKDPNRVVDRVFTSKIKCHRFIRRDCALYTVAESESSASSHF